MHRYGIGQKGAWISMTNITMTTIGRNHRRGRGFTLIDLLMVVLIVCMLSGMVFSAGALARSRETANRVKCASNLRMIGQACMLYANENRGAYPRTLYKVGEAVTQYTGVDSKDPFAKEGAPKANDVTSPFFLLIRTQDITPVCFVCPSTDATAAKWEGATSAQDFSNFKSEENLSYSYANAYPDAKAINAGYKLNATASAEFAIAADMNPGTFGESDVTPAKGPRDETAPVANMRKANSMNHRGDGENILFGDGHVEFNTTPFAGVKRDNIYTVSGSTDGSKTTSDKIAESPAWAGDSVLLPAATTNPHKKTPDEENVAAAKEFREQLPRIKAMIAQEEQKNGETARVKEIKQRIAEAEKEADEVEAKAARGGAK
jgi:prepilin-type processing-associated H-X9-DG protein